MSDNKKVHVKSEKIQTIEEENEIKKMLERKMKLEESKKLKQEELKEKEERQKKLDEKINTSKSTFNS